MTFLSKEAGALERLYNAIVEQRSAHLADQNVPLVASSDLVFDPTHPNETDWERILSQAAGKLIKKKTTHPKPATA